MRTLRAARAAEAAVVLLYLVSLVPGVRSHTTVSATFWETVVYLTALYGAAATCWLRVATIRSDRLPWAFAAAGLTAYATGTCFYQTVLQYRDTIPAPSGSDALWLLLYPTAIVSVGLLVRRRLAGSSTSMWLDGLVSGLGLASAGAWLVFPRVAEHANGPSAEVITNLAYPLLDLALVTAVLGAMAVLSAWRDRGWMLLAAGFLFFAVDDWVYLIQTAGDVYHPGSAVDGGYLVAVTLIAWAATVPASVVAAEPAQSRSFFVPGSFALLALAVLVAAALTPNATSRLGVWLAVGALAAAGVRTSLAVQEVMRLSDSRRQAMTDALTGLPNRRAFYAMVEAALPADGLDTGERSAVLIIDLDRFKEVNDALGHQVGDRVLRSVCDRLAWHVGGAGTIARLGGDEMAVYMPRGTIADAISLSNGLLAALEKPFTVDDLTLHLGASIGITQAGAQGGVSRALAEADLAMYRAKAAHSGWEVYDDAQDRDAWDRLATVEALRAALSGNSLSVAFQPIMEIHSLRLCWVETLVRWRHPVRGQIAPDVFLPMAEQTGLMPSLTRTVIDQALDQALDLHASGFSVPVSVNLSASDLIDSHLDEYISSALGERGLTGSALRIEITESLLVNNDGPAGALLLRIRELGIELSVDDYGTGYSSLAYLHDLPVSTLKIDRNFTQRLLLDTRTGTIVSSTIDMAHRLNLSVVAEGVETGDQLDWLRLQGCDYVQGFLLGRPMHGSALLEWIEQVRDVAPPLAHSSRSGRSS